MTLGRLAVAAAGAAGGAGVSGGLDISVVIPIIVALLAGGAVALYTARPQKDSIIATAASTAVDVVNKSLSRLEGELEAARDRIAILEKALAHSGSERIDQLERDLEVCKQRVARLRAALLRHGLNEDSP